MNYRINKDQLQVFAYVIMTNHIHVVWKSDIRPLSMIVRDFKRKTSSQIIKEVAVNPKESRREWLKMIFRHHASLNNRSGFMQFWTHENHAVELVTNEMIDQRINYIHENPVRAGIVTEASAYAYSSARDYAGDPGWIPVERI